MAKIKSYKDASVNVKSFDEETWGLFLGAEEWTLKDGTVVDPFYRLYDGYYVLGTKIGVFFCSDKDEVCLHRFERSTPTAIKRILELLPETLKELIEEHPAIADAI